MKRLDGEQHGFLKTLFEEASKIISVKMEKWCGEKIGFRFLDVNFSRISEIAGLTGLADVPVVATLFPVLGGPGGYVLFLMPEMSGRVFVDVLLKRDVGGTEDWNELEQSAIMETGNILASAFVSELARSFDVPLSITAPVFFMDFAGPIVEQITMEYAVEMEHILLSRTKFSNSKLDFEEHFLYIPGEGFLEMIEDRIK